MLSVRAQRGRREVGLHSLLLVELQLFVFVIRATYFSAAKLGLHQSP